MRLRIGAVVALSIMSGATLLPQTPFRSGIDLIQVDALPPPRKARRPSS